MTRNDEFDQTLAAWLHREAPPQAPDRVLDAALQRVAVQSQKRSWLHRLVGETPMAIMTRAAAVAAVVAIAALIGFQFNNLVTNPGNSESPSASPSTSASSASPTPTTGPSDAALVLRLMGGGEAGRVHVVTVWDDGGVFTTTDPGGVSPPAERRLTPTGLQLLRDELDATGLDLSSSATYMPTAKPGSEPPGLGGAGPALEIGVPGGGTAVISWVFFDDIDHLYDLEPQPEAEALEALAAQLSTMDEWLSASAWADADPSLPAGCPAPDVEALSEFVWPASDIVACYRDTPLTFDATWLGGGVADCPSAPEPAWLACSGFSLQAAGDTRKVGASQLFVAVDISAHPSLPGSQSYPQVRVTGHFDDPAAQTCRETELGGGAETLAPVAETVERCRRTFVVTQVVLLD